MATTLLIGTTYLKEFSSIDENVDEKVLKNAILEAQEFRILPILGTALYNAVATTTPSSWSAAYQTLVNTYIKPALRFWVLHDSYLELSYKIMNKGVLKRNSENTETVALPDMFKLVEPYKIKAEFYSERITKYLIENSTSYPLYTDAGSGYDTVHPKKNNYTQGIYLGRGCDCLIDNIDIDKSSNKCR